MAHQKFDLTKLERLNDPGRFDTLPPQTMWRALGCPDHVRTIVEIGAGTGVFSAAFARLAPNATVFAVDLAPQMIEWMQHNRPEVEEGRIIPILAEETRIPLADGIAQIAIMINLHHELADPRASYTEAFRLLAPGGRLLVVDWAPGESPKGPPQRIRVTAKEAESFLLTAGFTEVESHPGLGWAWMVTGDRA